MEQALLYGTCIWIGFTKLLTTSLALMDAISVSVYRKRSKLGYYKKPSPSIWSPASPRAVITPCVSPPALCKHISRQKDVPRVKPERETTAHQKEPHSGAFASSL